MSAILLALVLGAAVLAGVAGLMTFLAWVSMGPEDQLRYRMAAMLLVFWMVAAASIYVAMVDERGAA